MTLKKSFGMKFFANYPIIDSESPKRLKDIEATITPEIRKAYRSRTSGARSTAKKLQCFFHRGGETLRQFDRKNLFQTRLFKIPMDLVIHIRHEHFGSDNAQHQAALASRRLAAIARAASLRNSPRA